MYYAILDPLEYSAHLIFSTIFIIEIYMIKYGIIQIIIMIMIIGVFASEGALILIF
jgi:hypothetical protein